MREYNPERYPEEFKRIREAYETLYDPEARSDYDAMSNPVVSAAIKQGQKALEEEAYERAIECFKKALVLSPQAHFVRNLLGLSYIYASQNEEGLRQFETLTKTIPRNALYWNHRGMTERKLLKYEAAEASFRQALELDPEDSDAIEGLANAVFNLERPEEAEEILQRAIHADGVVDFDDFSFFFELITQKVLQGDVDGVRELAKRVEASLSEHWQRERVGYRFASVAHQLLELNAFDLALAIAERSHALVPDDETIEGLTKVVRSNHDTIEQMAKLRDDPAIREGFKFALTTLIRSYFDWWESEQEEGQWSSNAVTVLIRESNTLKQSPAGWTLKDELVFIRRRYPEVGKVVPDGIVEIIARGSGEPAFIWVSCPHCYFEARAPHQSASFNCPQCGNAFNYDSQKGETSLSVQQGSSCLLAVVLCVAFAVIASLVGSGL